MIYKENALTMKEFLQLRNSVQWNIFSNQQSNKAIENTYYDIVAYDEDQAIGMGRVIGDGIYFLIVDVVIHPDYQGKGIGKSIINKLVNYIDNNANGEEPYTIQLFAAEDKRSFYEKLGFKPLPNTYGLAIKKN